MRSLRSLFMLCACSLCALPAVAQVTGSSPQVTLTHWAVTRFGVTTVVYDRDGAIGSVAAIDAFQHMELDRVSLSLEVTDPDWISPITTDPQTGEMTNENEEVFLRFEVRPIPTFGPPDAPPVLFNPVGWFPTNEGFKPIPGPTTPYKLPIGPFNFTVPDINGRSQERLLGHRNYDVLYTVQVCAANDPDTDPQPEFIGCFNQAVSVIENPALRPGSPQVFADAGGDQQAVVGDTIELDGSRTFDSYNVGFDPSNPFVIEQHTLQFAWEWVSGPIRVDPLQTGNNNPVATATFSTAGTYVFRLTTDTLESSGPPSSDTMTVLVRQTALPQNPPTAVIVGPASAVVVGQTITLDGSTSSDPDGDALTFRWRQTNALGQALSQDELLDGFQALSGVTTNKISWLATTPGTYYFRLLVSDATFTSVANFTVNVIANSTAGENAVADAPASESDSAAETPAATPPVPLGLCGAGLAPLGLLPLALLAMRRRR